MRHQVIELAIVSDAVLNTAGVLLHLWRQRRTGAGIKQPGEVPLVVECDVQRQPGRRAKHSDGGYESRRDGS